MRASFNCNTWATCSVCIFVGALGTLPAYAQSESQSASCGVLPAPHTSPQFETAERIVIELLQERGFAAMVSTEVEERLNAQGEVICRALECGALSVRALHLTFVIHIDLGSSRRATFVSVGLADADGNVAGQADVTSSLEDAVRAATVLALDRWYADQQGVLVVETNPAGARILIDNQGGDPSPLRRVLPQGAYEVRAVLAGYDEVVERAVITRRQETRVLLDLHRPVVPPPQSSGPWSHYAVAGGLLALGLGLAVLPLANLAQDGQCVTEIVGASGTSCNERVEFGDVSTALAIGSAGAIALGVGALVIEF